MAGAADVTVPEGFGLDVFPTEDADELAGVGVGCVWMFDSTSFTLLT